MKTITKKELIERVAGNLSTPQSEVKRVVQAFLDEVVNELVKDNRLEFRDFGVFQCRSRAARVAQNPKTLDRVIVPNRRKAIFKAGRLMKARINATTQAISPAHTNVDAPPATSTKPLMP